MGQNNDVVKRVAEGITVAEDNLYRVYWMQFETHKEATYSDRAEQLKAGVSLGKVAEAISLLRSVRNLLGQVKF